MTIDINKNSALIDSAASGYSGCGCGNRRYYTKAEIDEMLKDVLDPEQIKQILDEMFEEYIEGGELEQLIIDTIAGLYTNEEIDEMLEELEARMKTWTGEQGYLKDITLTINGTRLHNNGSIVIEGGDVSNKLDITAFTQAMQNETARTETTYAKKSEIPSLEGYATQDWVGDQGFLKDITLTINGTELHNNGDIVIPGGGGEPVDISGKLDTTAYTQGMASETARTENTYAKISDLANKLDTTAFTEFKTEMEVCCDDVNSMIGDLFSLINDLSDKIDEITGSTPTPDTGDTPTASTLDNTIEITYNVTSSTNSTNIVNNISGITSIKRIDDTSISISPNYTFPDTGLQKLVFTFNNGNTVASQFASNKQIVDIKVGNNVNLEKRCFYHNINLTGVTFTGNSLKSPGMETFSTCNKLRSVSGISNAKWGIIRFGLFLGDDNLTSNMSLPETLKTIQNQAFYDTHPTTVIIPSSVTTINTDGTNTLGRPTSYVRFLGSTPPVVNSASSIFIAGNCPIYVPSASVTLYKQTYTGLANRIQAWNG